MDIERILINKYRKYLYNRLDKGSISNIRLKYTNRSYIKKLYKVWGDTIDYSGIEYKGANSPVKLRCLIHNHKYTMRAHRAIEGVEGCKYCNIENLKETCKRVRTNENLKLGQKEAIKRLELARPEYDCSNSVYNGYDSEITVICKQPGHGEFTKLYYKILTGHTQCPVCGKRKFNFKEAEEIRKQVIMFGVYNTKHNYHIAKRVSNFEGAYEVDYVYSQYKKLRRNIDVS